MRSASRNSRAASALLSASSAATDIKVPIRITNNDGKKPIDILDVKITPLDNREPAIT